MISQCNARIKKALNRLRSVDQHTHSQKRNREIEALIQEVEWLSQVNTAFRESEAQAHMMMDAVGECMTLLDKDLHIIWANKAGLDLFGSMVGKKCYQVYHRKDEPCDSGQCPVQRTFSDGKPRAHDTQVFDRKGNKIFLHCTFNVAIKDNSGKPAAAISIARDITERVQLERVLMNSKREWERTFDAIGELVSIHDRDLCIIRCNRAVLDLFGLSWSDLIGKQCHDVFGCHVDYDGRCALEKTLRDGKSRSEEISLPGLQKTYWVTIYPLQGDGSELEGVIRVAKDISERKILEAQVRQTHKMVSIGSLTGGIVHDFNNLLAAIHGFTQLTSELLPSENKKCHENLQKVMDVCEHAKALVRQILSFSRGSDEELAQPVLLNAILKESLSLTRMAFSRNVEIREVVSCDSAKVFADPVQIHQVLMNLCTNASQAMAATGGVLELALDKVHVDNRVLSQTADLHQGSYCLLTVRDTGEGMDEQTMKRIFEPFFTTKPAGKGTGLGLSVVQGIVKKYKGAIRVQSEKGKGSCFQIFLPEFQDLPAATEKGNAGRSIPGRWEISPYANQRTL
jgi:two-component system cell cycle sensor histidine kinase/response regulator CckA